MIAANAGPKTRIAREIGAADEVVELDREDPEGQWRRLGEENPRGFDVVVSFSFQSLFFTFLGFAI